VTSGRLPLAPPPGSGQSGIWYSLATKSESNGDNGAEVTSGRVPLAPPPGSGQSGIWYSVATVSESESNANHDGAEVTSGGLPGSGYWTTPEPSADGAALATSSRLPAKVISSDYGSDFVPDRIDPSFFVNTTVPKGLEVLRGKAKWFNGTEDFEHFWQSQQKPGRFGHVVDWNLLHRELQLLHVQEILKESVLLLCHRAKPEVCHLPLHGQTFYVALVKFLDNGQMAHMFFTQHMMDPSCNPNCLPSCNPDCGYMYHASDHILFRHKKTKEVFV